MSFISDDDRRNRAEMLHNQQRQSVEAAAASRAAVTRMLPEILELLATSARRQYHNRGAITSVSIMEMYDGENHPVSAILPPDLEAALPQALGEMLQVPASHIHEVRVRRSEREGTGYVLGHTLWAEAKINPPIR